MKDMLIFIAFSLPVIISQQALGFDVVLCETTISRGFRYDKNEWKAYDSHKKKYLVESIQNDGQNLDARICQNAIDNMKKRTVVEETSNLRIGCYRRSDVEAKGMWDYGIEACWEHYGINGNEVAINCPTWSFVPDNAFHVKKMGTGYSSGTEPHFHLEAGNCQIVR